MNVFHSITFRFTVWYLLILLVLLVFLSGGVYFYLSQTLYDNLDDSIRIRSEQLINTRGASLNSGLAEFQEDLGEVVMLFVSQDDVLQQISVGNATISAENDLIRQAFAGESDFATVADGDLRLYAVPVALRPTFGPGMMGRDLLATQSGVLVVGRSTADIDDALSNLVRTLLVAVPMVMIVAGAGGVFLARRALKPVGHIAQTALEIEESGNLSQRIDVKTRDELGRLASILNRMIERLDGAFTRQKEFTADASHELRAPLAVIQAEATLALKKERTAPEYRSSLETVAKEVSHMSLLVDQLLTLARADGDIQQMVFETVELDELLAEVIMDAETLSRDKGIEFCKEQIDHLLVKGDASKLSRLFLNLMENAIRYTPKGGTVAVSLVREGKMARMTVSDTGIGISSEDIPRIFERFYRVDKARSRAQGGSGLGLAISRQIAEIHGGRIEVESIPGEGSRFSVILPLFE